MLWRYQAAQRLASVVLILASLLAVTGVRAEGPVLPGVCSEADRFGVGASGRIGDYEVNQLHAGWHTTYQPWAWPAHPAGMEFVQTLRVSDDGPLADRECSACPTWSALREWVQANPGSLWLIGNEPDRQDYVYPERYASIYHSLHTFLKQHDASSLVGIGGVVQPTPVRRQYLDLILNSYQAQYGSPMPVDVWNIHNYVLREKRPYAGCPDCWGCGVPPGVPQNQGILYDWWEHDMLDPHPTDPTKIGWKQQIIDFRQWMKDRGQQNKPLIISEFGTLMWELLGFDYPRVRDFMLATFDFLTTAADSNTGYPADGYRLVQAWAWYSLDEDVFEGFPVANNLFDPETRLITPLGLDYAAYTDPLTAMPVGNVVDLEVVRLHVSRPLVGSAGITLTLAVEVRNGGTVQAPPSALRLSRSGYDQSIPLPALEPAQSLTVEQTWSGLSEGIYLITATADPENQVAECKEHNNRRSRSVCACDEAVFLPIVLK